MTLRLCPHGCGKKHRTFAQEDKCREKKARTTCDCPRYWRKRWPDTHSYPHGCPLADK